MREMLKNEDIELLVSVYNALRQAKTDSLNRLYSNGLIVDWIADAVTAEGCTALNVAELSGLLVRDAYGFYRSPAPSAK
jgi:hypothetical protein